MKTTNGRWLADGLAAAIGKTKEEKNVSIWEHSRFPFEWVFASFDGYMISEVCERPVTGK